MKVRLGVVAGALAVVSALTVVVARPASAAFITVAPGQSIQAAIDAAPPGSIVLVQPGVYTESVGILKDNISLIGSGAASTIVQSPAFPGGPCADFGGTIGVCVVGQEDPLTGDILNPASGVMVTGFTFRNYLAFGALVRAAENAVIVNNRFENNRVYGVYSNNSTGTQLLANTATGSEEAGLYIGDSPNARAQVQTNTVSNNRYGIFIRAASNGTIANNTATGNCEGIFILGAPDRSTNWLVAANQVNQNNKACPPRGPSAAISGAGIGLVNSHNNTLSGNSVNGNVPSGPTSSSGGILMISGTGNRISRNTAFGNVPADILNVAGPTNVVTNNACGTSIPPGFCSGGAPAT